ncbi:MAG: hypothetical protein LBO73_00860 [Holosporaceae bacterium]|nr:hypothetical protein [Holosporaceae bacterium]
MKNHAIIAAAAVAKRISASMKNGNRDNALRTKIIIVAAIVATQIIIAAVRETIATRIIAEKRIIQAKIMASMILLFPDKCQIKLIVDGELGPYSRRLSFGVFPIVGGKRLLKQGRFDLLGIRVALLRRCSRIVRRLGSIRRQRYVSERAPGAFAPSSRSDCAVFRDSVMFPRERPGLFAPSSRSDCAVFRDSVMFPRESRGFCAVVATGLCGVWGAFEGSVMFPRESRGFCAVVAIGLCGVWGQRYVSERAPRGFCAVVAGGLCGV